MRRGGSVSVRVGRAAVGRAAVRGNRWCAVREGVGGGVGGSEGRTRAGTGLGGIPTRRIRAGFRRLFRFAFEFRSLLLLLLLFLLLVLEGDGCAAGRVGEGEGHSLLGGRGGRHRRGRGRLGRAAKNTLRGDGDHLGAGTAHRETPAEERGEHMGGWGGTAGTHHVGVGSTHGVHGRALHGIPGYLGHHMSLDVRNRSE